MKTRYTLRTINLKKQRVDRSRMVETVETVEGEESEDNILRGSNGGSEGEGSTKRTRLRWTETE